ncbi:MAG TPA: hypothetical protein VK745_25095 [Polyangiaceae bacterium]|nr:hypothetical protein [Polyangiaceae bacterium]
MVLLSLFNAADTGAGAGAGTAGFTAEDLAGGGAFGAGSGPLATGTAAGLATEGRVGEMAGFFGSGFVSTFGATFGSRLDATFGWLLASTFGATGGGAGAASAAEASLAASIADGGSLPSNASPTPAMLDTWMTCPHLRHFMRTERPATFSSAI